MYDRSIINPYYPIFLNINTKKCVVIGGGPVAYRKVRSLIDHGAEVTVISPAVCGELLDLSTEGKIKLLMRGYRKGDMRDAYLGIIASGIDQVNGRAAAEAAEKGVLVNVVDDPDKSAFIVPSVVCRKDVTIAISTGGKSPALARKIRTRLEQEIGEEYGLLAQVIGEVRSQVHQQGIEIPNDDWQEAIDLDIMIALLREDCTGKKARAYLMNKLEELKTNL